MAYKYVWRGLEEICKVAHLHKKRLTQKVSVCFFMRGEKFRRITTDN